MDILGETLRKPLFQKLTEEVTRSYEVGLRFTGKLASERRSQELFAASIVLDYQQEIYHKLSPEKVSQACEIVKQMPELSGTKGSAILRRELGDCSNLGEAAYLPLLQTIKGMFVRQVKLQTFFELIEEKENELLSWFLFGRAPYGEQLLQRKLRCSHKYVADMILGARRSLDKYLTKDQQLKLNAPYPSLNHTQLQQGLTRFKNNVEQSIAEQLCSDSGLNNSPTTRQKTFMNKLERIEKFKEPVIQMIVEWLKEWNTENPQKQKITPRSRWGHLKILSREVASFLVEKGQPSTGEYAYRSILRGILITALLPHYDEGRFVTQLQVKGIVAVDKLIAKPFSQTKPSYQQKLPLQLLMGSKYVIERPGNSAKITELALKTGEIPLQFWPYRKKKLLVEGKIRLHKSLLSFLKQGAKITLLVIAAGNAPAHKLKVTIVMTGKRKMFFTRKEIHKLQQKLPVISPSITKFNDGIGLDVNRLGEFMLIFSEEYPNKLPKIQLKLIERYKALACPVSELGIALTRKRKYYKLQPSKEAHIAWLKVKGELERVYKRRHRLLKTIHQKAGQWVATVLYHSNTRNLIIEDLKLTAKGTRGALAKIILSLPDEQDLFERSTLIVEWLTGKKQTLILVDPRNTSQGEHVACIKYPKGKIKRTKNEWDYARCNACDKHVNTHHNAAMIIRQRGLDYLAKIS